MNVLNLFCSLPASVLRKAMRVYGGEFGRQPQLDLFGVLCFEIRRVVVVDHGIDRLIGVTLDDDRSDVLRRTSGIAGDFRLVACLPNHSFENFG